jgi:tetratricopeptide (TPR) repeat protein
MKRFRSLAIGTIFLAVGSIAPSVNSLEHSTSKVIARSENSFEVADPVRTIGFSIAQAKQKSNSDYFASAERKYSAGDYQGALADYNRAIELNPKMAIAYNNRGSLKENQLQDLQGALSDYDRAIKLNPKMDFAYNNRGLLKTEKLQDIQGGIADFDRAIQINPNYALAYGNRGYVKHDRLNDKTGGITDMQKAAKLFKQQGNTKKYQFAIDALKKWQSDK